MSCTFGESSVRDNELKALPRSTHGHLTAHMIAEVVVPSVYQQAFWHLVFFFVIPSLKRLLRSGLSGSD